MPPAEQVPGVFSSPSVKVVALLFFRGDRAFILTTQNNFRDLQYESEGLAKLMQDYRRSLEEFYASFRFGPSAADPSVEVGGR